MADIQLPVFTGENFQILKTTLENEVWHVHAKFGDVEKNLEVRGTAEHVLQVMNALSKTPEKIASLRNRARFIVENGQVLGQIIAKAKSVSPFHLHLFKSFT